MTEVTREMAVEAAKNWRRWPLIKPTVLHHSIEAMAKFIEQLPAESQCRNFVERCFSRFQDCLVSESTTDIFGEQTKAALTAELMKLVGGASDDGEPDPDADTPTTILQELIDDLQVPNSLGVSGSDFTTCLGCNGGIYPGKDGYVHGKGCPVEKAEKKLAGIAGTQPNGGNDACDNN